MTYNDYLGDKAANWKLINLIQTFWRKRGHKVKAWVEKANDPSNGSTIFVVRTDVRQDLTTLNPRHTTI